MNAKRDIFSLRLCLFTVLLVTIHCIASVSIFAQTNDAYLPEITKNPIPLSTNAKGAALMLYTQALPQDDGSLVYQWYTSTVTADYPLPLSNVNVSEIIRNDNRILIPGETHFNLSTTTPTEPGVYYYWCMVTNTKGGPQCFKESDITKVVVIDKELHPQLMNGGFQEFWDFDGTTVGTSNADGNYNATMRSGRAMVNNGRQRGWTNGGTYPQANNYPYRGGNYLRGTTVWDCENAPTAVAAAGMAWNNNTANWSANWATGTGTQNVTNEVKPTTGTFFALPPTGAAATAAGRGVKYWETTHALNVTGVTGYSNGKTIQLMVATGLGHNATFLDPRGHNQGYIPGDPAWYSYPYVVELNPDQPSSLYQEIATVPGKIYEWSLDHAPRDGRPANANIMAVVIGPAMNSSNDYTSVGLTGTNNRWGLGNGSYTINGNTQYQGFNRAENYPYGSVASAANSVPTPARQTYFLDVVDNLGFTKNEASYMVADRQSLVSKYPNNENGRNYFVYIGAAEKSVKETYVNPNGITGTFYEMYWTHHSGVYSVPEGQGISVFSFVGLLPTGASGNILDNITFKSGTPPVFDVGMYYSGLVNISAQTRADYVYGIAEVRGSSVNTFTESVTFNDAPISPHNFGDGIGHWFYPQAEGTITFSNMTPGKTYRVVGIPRGAVSGGSQLNTNRTPALVLDDGYYEEVTIPGTSAGGGDQMSTVGSGDGFIFLANANENVEYALLDADLNIGDEGWVVEGWKSVEVRGQSLFFEGLERGHCYELIVRPAEYLEITYEVAAASSGVVVCTPSINDIKPEQVTRVRNADGTDKITIRQADDIVNGISDKGEHIILNTNEYRYYDAKTGSMFPALGVISVDESEVVFDGLPSDGIYHITVKEGSSSSMMIGVRVYPAVRPYYINYEEEWIAYDDQNTPIPNTDLDAKVEYRIHANDANETWLIGDSNNFILIPPGGDYIRMGERENNNPSILDQMGTLSADATIESRFVDLWPTSNFPSVFPLSTFEVPRRPAAPESTVVCEAPNASFVINYPEEKITVNSGLLLSYSTNNGVDFTLISVSPPDNNEVKFSALGWSGAELIVPLRIPAVAASSGIEGKFASEINMQRILGRGSAPRGPYARMSDDRQTVDIVDLVSNISYEYRLQGQGIWIPVEGVTEVLGLPYVEDEEGTEIDYEIRYGATCTSPASLPQRLSMPLSIAPIDFGNVVYGYDFNAPALIKDIVIRNVASVEVEFGAMILDENTKNDVPMNVGDNIFQITPAVNNRVPSVEDGGENTEAKIKLMPGLSVGTYRAILRLIFSYEGGANNKITTIEVFLNVTKATRPNPLVASSHTVTANSFEIDITGAPGDSKIEYSIGGTTYDRVGGEGGADVIDNSFTGLNPAGAYTIFYRVQECENYYATDPKQLIVYTAYATPPVGIINVDYGSERLNLNVLYPSEYRVTVNDDEVTMPYILSEVVDLGEDIKVSVTQIGPPATNFPNSASLKYTIAKRRSAPAVTLMEDVNGNKNTINISGEFQYRRARRTVQWTTVSNSHKFENWGSYQIRYPATVDAFASQYSTVHILPNLSPTAAGELYVNVGVDPGRSNGEGSSWENATSSLSAALAYARIEQPNAVVKNIYVATGIYTPEVSATETNDERDYAFVLPANVTITGGYNVSPSGIVSNQSNNQSTILSGKLDDIAANAYHVVIAGNAHHTTLNRLVITGGNANGIGMINIGSSNLPDDDEESQLIHQGNGAGLYASGTSNLKLVNVSIHSNRTTGNGGGIYIAYESTVSLTNVTVSGNSAEGYGGGVYNADTLSIGNTIIYGNTANYNGSEEIYNDNAVGASHGIFNMTYSLVKGMALASNGEGNLNDESNSTSDSLFLSPAINNYRLRQNSVAHNTGSSDVYIRVFDPPLSPDTISNNSNVTDVAGKVRIVGNIDMGAYEVQGIEIMTDDNARLTNNAPVIGGTLIKIKATDYCDLLLSNLEVILAGTPAKVVPAVANSDRVGSDGVIHCVAGVSDQVLKGAIEIKYKNNTGDAVGRLIGVTAPRSFTYYPVVFIEDGKWSEYYKWEGQTGELILPYPNAKIQIKANCLQDMDVQMDSITVYPGRAYTIGSGKNLTANVFTLKDNASFLRNGGTMAVGRQNVEHTLSKGRNWYISNPVDMTSLNPGTLTVTNPSNPGVLITPGRIEKYNETNKNWERVTVTDGLETGRGHTIYSAATDMTVNFSGTYNDGNIVSPQLTRSTSSGDKNGFNLVGNPFPSYWRWTETAANAANVYSTIWYRTNVGGNYEFWSYNASGNVAAAPGWEDGTLTGSSSLGYVPPMQAFWVRVREGETSGTLTFTDSNRTHADHGSNVMVRSVRAEENRPLLRLIVGNDMRTDETVIYADPAAKKDFDTYDSEKWFVNNGVEIFTLPASLSRELVINGLPAIKDGTEIPVGFQTDEGGAFRFHAKELLNLDDMNVFLLDKLRGMEFDLRNGDYDFTASSVPVTDRFSIVFRSTQDTSGNDGLTAYVDKDRNIVVTLYLKDQEGKNAAVSVFDTSGRKVTEQRIFIGERTILKDQLLRGVYMLRAGKYAVKVAVP